MFNKIKNYFAAAVEESSRTRRMNKLDRLEKKISKLDNKLAELQYPELVEFNKVQKAARKTLNRLGGMGPASRNAPTVVSNAIILAAILEKPPAAYPSYRLGEVKKLRQGLIANVERMALGGLAIPQNKEKVLESAGKQIKKLAGRKVKASDKIEEVKAEKQDLQQQSQEEIEEQEWLQDDALSHCLA